jgi:glycosyltransferase involved in cell wall biosynthesis
MPTFSVITPLYNKAAYIEETIQTMLDQTFDDWEMLIVDNLSTDGGFDIARKHHDPRLRFLSNPMKGPGATRNHGLGAATGDWILYLDADDLLLSDYLSHLNQISLENRQADIIASPWIQFRENEPNSKTLHQPCRALEIEDFAIANTCWAIHAAVTKRSWIGEKRWPVELDQFLAEDTAYWFRIVTGANIVYTDFAGALYRTHSENCRSDYNANAWFKGNHQAMLSNLSYLETQGIAPSIGQMEFLVRLYSELYLRATKSGDDETANHAYQEAGKWLREFENRADKPGLSMKLRSLLGLKVFENLRHFYLSFRPGA